MLLLNTVDISMLDGKTMIGKRVEKKIDIICRAETLNIIQLTFL